LAVPFAFAVAALLTGRLGDDWIAVSRRWMLLVWLLLGVGNMVGAWWAYVELGWGGYWNWDPVENAGLMPWLVATAFLHSALMQRRRGTFRLWNMVLVILAFNLAIFGTFLTRSGFLSSVHTFNESSLGHFFLVFMVFTFLGSLVLLGYRSGVLKSHAGTEAIVSKQSTFLLNNLLMVGVTAAIFIGTIFPVISRGITGATIGVGPSFFNQVVGPTSLAIILLTGICTLIDWRRSSLRELAGNIIWPLAVALALGIALFFSGIGEWYALAAFITGGFTLATVLYKWLQDVRARHRRREENYLRTFKGLMTANRTRYGSYIAHLAIICITIGMVGSSLYSVENTAVLSEGDSMSIKGYSLTYENVEIYEEGSKIVVATSLAVYGRGRLLSRLTPEKHYYWSYPYPVTEIAIRSTLIEDLYVIPVEWSDDGTATFKVIVNPLVAWIWVGGGALMLGGLIVFWPGSSEQNKVSIGSSYQS
jgi:cytochrome c-type biogenesis protein CcmF